MSIMKRIFPNRFFIPSRKDPVTKTRTGVYRLSGTQKSVYGLSSGNNTMGTHQFPEAKTLRNGNSN
jgi:hypothetical protein